jgi:phosphoribosylaminoimidazole-succinocarboxamide synthase
MPPTTAHNAALLYSQLALPNKRVGKVRDVYDLPAACVDLSGVLPAEQARGPQDLLLIVASDRISAFDVVMPTPLAGKGALLTEMAVFWQRMIEARGLCATHLVSSDASLLRDACFRDGGTTREQLAGRIMIARRARVVPIECVARGYLEGSGWKEYQASGSVCGVRLPAGLRQCEQLAEPIFTPATKEEQGKHDENISFERASALVGRELMEKLRRLTLSIYALASEHALPRGIRIADTKFEFGLDSAGEIMLVDEALTPDSSRFWPSDSYEPGRAQRSFDKQYLREYLETLVASGRWNKAAPGPELPDSVVSATLAKYVEARDRLVG